MKWDTFAVDDNQLTVMHEGDMLATNRFVAIMIGISLDELIQFFEDAGTVEAPFPLEWRQRIRLRYQEGSAHKNCPNWVAAFDWWTRKDGHRIVVRDGNAYLEPVS